MSTIETGEDRERDGGEMRGKGKRSRDSLKPNGAEIIDLQAFACFGERVRQFPSPVSRDPFVYGMPGLMYHVEGSYGEGLELPGGGKVIWVSEKVRLLRRSFAIRKFKRSRRGESEEERVLGHGIYCWHILREDLSTSVDYVICYSYPPLTRREEP